MDRQETDPLIHGHAPPKSSFSRCSFSCVGQKDYRARPLDIEPTSDLEDASLDAITTTPPEPEKAPSFLDKCAWFLAKPYASGVDADHAYATRYWRNHYLPTGDNPLAEYPRISRRFPRRTTGVPCCNSKATWVQMLEPILLPDSITENVWSALHVVLGNIVALCFMSLLYPSLYAKETFSWATVYFETTMYYLYLLATSVWMILVAQPLRLGANIGQPGLLPYLLPFYGAGLYYITRSDGLFPIAQWTSSCGIFCQQSSNRITWLFMVACYGLLLLMSVVVMLRLMTPLPLIRRRYSYRYVRELLTPRRHHIPLGIDTWQQIVADADASRENSWHTEPEESAKYFLPGGGCETDLLLFVQQMRCLGVPDDAVAREIARASEAVAMNKMPAFTALPAVGELPIPQKSARGCLWCEDEINCVPSTPLDHQACMRSLRGENGCCCDDLNRTCLTCCDSSTYYIKQGKDPDASPLASAQAKMNMTECESFISFFCAGMHKFQNPHAVLRWTCNLDTPGNVLSEWIALPWRVKAGCLLQASVMGIAALCVFLFSIEMDDCKNQLMQRCQGKECTKCNEQVMQAMLFVKQFSVLIGVGSKADPGPLFVAMHHAFDWAAALACFVGMWSVYRMMQGYREMVFQVREQKVTLWNARQDIFTPFHCTMFLAGIMINSTLGIMILTLMIFLFIVTFAYAPMFEAIWVENLLPWFIALFITVIWFNGIVRGLIFDSLITSGGSIVWRRSFLASETTLQLFQFVISFYSAVGQIVYSLLRVTVNLFRADLTIMPKGMERNDTTFAALVSILYMHENHCSPIFCEAVDSLCEARKVIQGIAHLRRDLVNPPPRNRVRNPEEAKERLFRAEAAMRRRLAIVTNDGLLDVAAAAKFTTEDAAELRRFYVARNRWHLAVLLMKNPSLKKYRRIRLNPHPDLRPKDLVHTPNPPECYGICGS